MKWNQIASMTVAMAATLWVTDAHTATPCPKFPYKDGAFNYSRDAANCVLGAIEGGSPGSRVSRQYNLYCPGRMSTADAIRVGNAMAAGSIKPSGVDMRKEFAKFELKPLLAVNNPVPHRFEYGCSRNGKPTVATHVKLRFGSDPIRPSAAHHARYCKDTGSQSGNITIGKRMDREYRCDLHFWHAENGKAQDTARVLLSRDFQAEARAKQAKVCLLGSTDMQCAPCSSTNKLVVRVQTVEKGGTCPAGTLASVE